MKKKAAVIINPIAGGGRALRGWKRLRASLPLAYDFDVFTSEYPGHARDLSFGLRAEEYALALAIGGDGTIHEVVNGLLDAGLNGKGVYEGPPFSLVPWGRGNDFARTLGINRHDHSRWERILAGEAVVPSPVDVGRVHVSGSSRPQYFVNMCGAGFDADACWFANKLPRHLGGAVPYVLGVFASFISMTHRPMIVRLSGVQDVAGIDNKWDSIQFIGGSEIEVRDRLLLASVGIGKYQGGGIMLLPHALAGDGYVDVLLARRLKRLKLLRVLSGTFAGRHITEPEVAYFRARHVEITGPDNTRIQADGDHIGGKSATIDVLPALLPIIC